MFNMLKKIAIRLLYIFLILFHANRKVTYILLTSALCSLYCRHHSCILFIFISIKCSSYASMHQQQPQKKLVIFDLVENCNSTALPSVHWARKNIHTYIYIIHKPDKEPTYRMRRTKTSFSIQSNNINAV